MAETQNITEIDPTALRTEWLFSGPLEIEYCAQEVLGIKVKPESEGAGYEVAGRRESIILEEVVFWGHR